MAEEQVSGIALGLTLDPSGFSSGIARARSDVAALKRDLAALNVPVNIRAVRQAANAVGPAAVLPGGTAVSPSVSPRFQVSAGAVRDLRTDINAQFRTFASQGEAVAIPVRLGRIPFGDMRRQIQTGIGEVPIRVTIDPTSIASALRQLSSGIVAGAAATAGIPRRAAGGGVEANRPVIVGERRAEVFVPTTNGRILPRAAGGKGAADLARYPQSTMERNLERLAASLTDRDRHFGRIWYPTARSHVLAGAELEGFFSSQNLGAMGNRRSMERSALFAAAAASPQMRWFANLAHSRAIARAAVQGGLPTKAMADANLPWVKQVLPPGTRMTSGVMGLAGRERDMAMRLIRGEAPEKVMRNAAGDLLPKVYPFGSNLTGNLDMLTLDSIAAQTATSGLDQWVKGAGFAKSPPPGIFRDAMSEAHRNVYERYKDQFPGGIAEFQAALWSKYRGEAFARGGWMGRRRAVGGQCFGCFTGSREPEEHTHPMAGSLESLMARAPAERGFETLAARRRGPFEPFGGGIRMYGGRPLDRETLEARDLRAFRRDTSRGPKPRIGDRFLDVDPLDLGSMGRTSYPRNAAGGPIFKPVDPNLFHSVIDEASKVVRPSGRRVGETVYVYPRGEYAQMRTFLNRDQTAGYAIKPDGDLVSVFNVGGKGAGKAAVRSAIQRGAYKLDAFDEIGSALAIGKTDPRDVQKNLPNFYRQFGFRETYRDTWNPEYAPPGWQGGTPDVVYMQRFPTRRRAEGGFTPYSFVPSRWSFKPPFQPDDIAQEMIDDMRGQSVEHLRIFNRQPRLPSGNIQRLHHEEVGTGTEVGEIASRMAAEGRNPYTGRIDVHNHPLMGGLEVPRPSMADVKNLLISGSSESMVVTPSWTTRMRRDPEGFRYDPGLWRKIVQKTVRPTVESLGLGPPNTFADVWSTRGGEGDPRVLTFWDELYSKLGNAFGFTLERERRATGGFCSTCRSNVRGSIMTHMGTKRHRAATAPKFSGKFKARAPRYRYDLDPWSRSFDEAEIPEGWVDPYQGEMAVGGRSRSGMYIVNELGREKFVPKGREGDIPPDVASRIPGGEMIGRGSGRGQIQTIPGGAGARLWSPPEDGWIIPAHLTNKIPQRQTGGFTDPGEGGAPPGRQSAAFYARQAASGQSREERDREQARQRREDEDRAQEQRRRDDEARQAAADARRARSQQAAADRARAEAQDYARRVVSRTSADAAQSLIQARGVPSTLGSGAALDQRMADIRINQALIRGLTGRAALGGVASGLFGGRQRRAAQFEAQAIQQELRAFLPQGAPRTADPLRVFTEQLEESQHVANTAAATLKLANKEFGSTSKEVRTASEAYDNATKAVAKNTETVERITGLRQRQEDALARATGGAAKNFLSVTAAGFAFSAGMQVLQLGIEAASQVINPLIDQFTGFSATSTRVTRQLADSQRELGGDTGAAVATAAGRAGVSGRGAAFLTGALGPAASATAGALSAADASQLFLAALGTGGAPRGLFGGFGGVGGGGFLAQLLGGGAGFTEVLSGDVEKFRAAADAATAAAQRPVGQVARPIGGLRPITMGPGIQQQVTPEDIAQSTTDAAQAMQTLTVYTQDQTEAAQRGAAASGELIDGIRLATKETLGWSQAQAQAAEQTMRATGAAAGDPNAGRFTSAGVFLVDRNGQAIADPDSYRRFFEAAALGRTIETPETFVRARQRPLQAQIQTLGVRGGLERGVQIPGQLGQQVFAQPFGSAFAGIADQSQVTLTNLEQVADLQAQITADAERGITLQADFIRQNVGTTEAFRFTGLMDQVRGYGESITEINDAIANRQAKLSADQYANNLRIINRSIGEARGLAGMPGGNRLGGLQREQFMLGRAAEALQLAAQELSIQLSQRQINFQRAIAGFQAPGITGEERAARMEEARIEADFAQRQLDLQRSQLGIGQQQFGIGGEVFRIQTQQAVVDLEAQKVLNAQSFALEQEQIAAQKRISALTIRQSQLQAEAQSIFAQATGVFDARLAVASQYVAQFGGTMAAAIRVVDQALDKLGGTISGGGGAGGRQTRQQLQTGFVGLATQATDVTFGEAGNEAYAILKNPRRGQLGGMGQSNVITININGAVVRDDSDIDMLARRVASVVEESLGTKAGLLS